jgi:type IX secretion system substrate protein
MYINFSNLKIVFLIFLIFQAYTFSFANSTYIKIDGGPDTLFVGQEVEYHGLFKTSGQSVINEWNCRLEAMSDSNNITVNSLEKVLGHNESIFTFIPNKIESWNFYRKVCFDGKSYREYNGYVILHAYDTENVFYSDVKKVIIYEDTGNDCDDCACLVDEIYFTSEPQEIQKEVTYTFSGQFDDANGSGTYLHKGNWKAKLFHSTGTFIIGADSVNQFNLFQCSWELSIEELPDSLDFIFTDSAKVLGFMQLTGLDSDGYYHGATQELFGVDLITALDAGENPQNKMTKFILSQNYPNPFNPATKIEFELDRSEKVKLSIFDIQGKLLYNLLDEQKTVGKHSIIFDATRLSAGVYFYQLKTATSFENKKMLLIK